MVTWPVAEGIVDARCLNCYFAMSERIASRSAWYREAFGIVPAFRVGLHVGSVVAGVCGDRKQEIVYFGDTVNTAARIEQSCKTLGEPFLISKDLLVRLCLPADLAARSMGVIDIRGRREGIELYSVERVGS